MSIRGILLERYVNVFNNAEKDVYADDVWDILQSTYEKLGGIKGSGFRSKDEMIKTFPLWKLVRKNEKIVACILYKDKNGRKVAAIGQDGSQEGKEALRKAFMEEVKTQRSFGEVSGPALRMAEKLFGDELEKYLIPAEEVSAILGKEVKILGKFRYTRSIGSDTVEKVMFGKPNQKIE